MRLLFDLSPADKAAFEAASAGERILYCLPFDCRGGQRVDGRMVFTDKAIYKVIDAEVEARWDFSELSDFSVEVLYGCGAFFAKVNGNTVRLCRFISGRNLTRYSIMVEACNRIVGGDTVNTVVSDAPERYCPKCGRPFIVNTHICPYCQSKRESYMKLWAMTKGLRLMMMVPLITAFIGMAITFVVPILQRTLIDDYIQNSNFDAKENWFLHFFLIVAAIVGFDILSKVISMVQGRIAAVAGNRFTRLLRTLLFEKIQLLSMSSVQKKSTGDLMGRINNDVAVVQNFITNLLPTYFAQLLSFFLGLVLILSMSPVMSAFVFVPIPFVCYAIYLFRHMMRRLNIQQWMKGNRTNRTLQDVLSGIRVVKAYGREEAAIEEFTDCTNQQAHQNEHTAKIFDTVFPLLGFALRFGSYLIMWYGNVMLFHGAMSVGELNQFNTYAAIIYNPLMQITLIPRNISAFATSFGKILEILEEEPDVADAKKPEHFKIQGNVSVQGVTFATSPPPPFCATSAWRSRPAR